MKKNILTTAFLMAIIASLGLFSVGCKKSSTKPKDTCEGVVMPNPYYKITSLKGVITDTTGKEKSNVVPEDYNKLCQYIYADKTQNLAIKKMEPDFSFINSAYAVLRCLLVQSMV
ncbi:MAG: hypothetical protein H7329_00030 [Opitutaceae bacterium]|nr:hypothetical protein [Cytophagales bacterium]